MHFPRIYDPRHELDLLKWEAEEIQRALAEVRDRIEELEGEPAEPA
jgi:hypothetical protein